MNRKLAINPLPWILGPEGFDLSAATLTPALRELRDAGFDAVHADVPAGWSSTEYSAFIASFGFRPAPGYFGADFTSPETRHQVVESARVHAASQAALGLTETFMAADLVPERIAAPAVGAQPSAERNAMIADGLAAAAAAMRTEGITAALHSHVGSWIETEDEIRGILDATAGSSLAFGPDTGHIAWAGGDPAALVRDYASRVAALHVKDVHQAAAAAARDAAADYWSATNDYHVWTEPGRGDVDFPAVFAALPAEFDGWYVVEVDVPDIGTPAESASVARSYLVAEFGFPERGA